MSGRANIWNQFDIGTILSYLSKEQKVTHLKTAGALSTVPDPQIWSWSAWMLERQGKSCVDSIFKASFESDHHCPVPTALQLSCLASCLREAVPKTHGGSMSLQTHVPEGQVFRPRWPHGLQCSGATGCLRRGTEERNMTETLPLSLWIFKNHLNRFLFIP